MKTSRCIALSLPILPATLTLVLLTLLPMRDSAHAQGAADASPAPANAEPATVLTGARLIDGTGRPPVEDSVIVIKGDRIAAVGSKISPPTVPPGAKLIDLSGRTIIPGLISAHSHLGLTRGAAGASPANYTRDNVAHQLAQYEACGVTAVMSLGVNRDDLYDWRNEQRHGQLPGADIFTADRGLGVPGGAPPFDVPGDQMYRPRNAEEARADVREMAARNPDIIKLWLDDIFGTLPKMSPDIFRASIESAHAAADEAHQHGLRVAAHLFYLADAKALVDAGVDVLAHSVRDKPVDTALIAAMKAKHVIYIPTLALDESQFIYAEHPRWMDDPLFTESVDRGLLETWLSPAYGDKMRANLSTARTKAAFAMGLKNVESLHRSGICIAMGTDSGAMPTRIAGFGEHRELQLLVRAGLSPMEAIVCATAHSALAIGQEADRGTIEPGKRADMLVLEANPLDDISNTTRLAAIWHGGRSIVPLTKRAMPPTGQP